jgi:hypothetical protein
LGVVLLLLSVFIVPPLEQEQHLHATPNGVLLDDRFRIDVRVSSRDN